MAEAVEAGNPPPATRTPPEEGTSLLRRLFTTRSFLARGHPLLRPARGTTKGQGEDGG